MQHIISTEQLISLLETAFDEGWNGYYEMKDGVVKQLVNTISNKQDNPQRIIKEVEDRPVERRYFSDAVYEYDRRSITDDPYRYYSHSPYVTDVTDFIHPPSTAR